MNTASLDDFMAINDQIVALVHADIPTGLGLGADAEAAAATLAQVNAAVARRVSRGESIAEAIGKEDAAPAEYRSVMQAGWRSDDPLGALRDSVRRAAAVEHRRHRTWSALFYPVLVCLLAAAGLAGYHLAVAPRLAALFQDLQVYESAGYVAPSLLQRITPQLAAGGIAMLTAIGVVAMVSQSRGGDGGRRSPAIRSRPGFDWRCMGFCAQLLTLLRAGTPLNEGIALAAEASGEPTLQEASRKLSSRATTLDGESGSGHGFPPFLRWALFQRGDWIDQICAIELAREVYHESAERRYERGRMLTPLLACIFLGGGAVLLYGLALFAPLTGLFETLAS